MNGLCKDLDMPLHTAKVIFSGSDCKAVESTRRPAYGPSKPLDKFDRTLPGVVQLKIIIAFTLLMGQSTTWLTQLSEIHSGNWSSINLDGKGRSFPRQEPVRTDERSGPDLEYLATVNLLDDVTRGQKRADRQWARFFKVPKGDGSVCRAIFDCDESNERCNPPPAMRLISIADLVWMMLSFEHPCVATCDLRHWFYELPIPKSVRHFFSIGLLGRIWELLVLPMGFRWSPWIAQSTSWTIALARLHEKGLRWEAPTIDDKAPPPFVRIFRGKKLVAFMAIYYDNFMIIAGDVDTRDLLVSRCNKNAAESHARWKYDFILSRAYAPGTPVTERTEPQHCDMLGIRFTRDGDKLLWSHIPSNPSTWEGENWLTPENIDPSGRRVFRCKAIAGIVGVAVWDACARLTPLAKIADAIGILRLVALQCGKDGWGSDIAITDEQFDTLRKAFSDVIANPISSLTNADRPTREVFYASDACDEHNGGWGYVILSRLGVFEGSDCGVWSREQAAEPIYIRELRAAWHAIRACPDGVRLVLAIDNAVAFSAIRRTYTSNTDVCELLLAERTAYIKRGIELFPVLVRSEDEAADNTSRFKVHNTKICVRCAELMRAASFPQFISNNANVQTRKSRAPKKRSRHE